MNNIQIASETRRIRIMLAVAAKEGCRNPVLGAWGCGAFGNDPAQVSAYFRQVIAEEQYGKAFSRIRFAVRGSENGKNYLAFCRTFGEGGNQS